MHHVEKRIEHDAVSEDVSQSADLLDGGAAIDQQVGSWLAHCTEARCAVLTGAGVGGAWRLVGRWAVAVACVVRREAAAALADLRADPAEEVVQP